LEKVLLEDAVKETLDFVKEKPIRQLLYSVGTRLGTFVPTIEVLARIYLGLRKKNDIIPGERLKIQEEVLVRYEKAPYTDSMAKKARNLALNYFMDYLTEYGMKLYKTSFNSVPQGNDNPEAHGRRHSAIRGNCANAVEEWGTRVGLSSHALFNVKARFMETADLFLKDQVGIDPVEMEQQAAN
jgi:hypothetical protein